MSGKHRAVRPDATAGRITLVGGWQPQHPVSRRGRHRFVSADQMARYATPGADTSWRLAAQVQQRRGEQ